MHKETRRSQQLVICFTYVFPCLWEDHCKVGFSRNPLGRLQSLHQRWFDFFDLESGFLIETETERDARDLELALRRPLIAHRAPMPMTVCKKAGGHTEWLRGAYKNLREQARVFHESGYRVHSPLRDWLIPELVARSDQLYAWTSVRLPELGSGNCLEAGHASQQVMDVLDAYRTLSLEVESFVAPEIYRWYRTRTLT